MRVKQTEQTTKSEKLNSILTWPGGKRLLAPRIVKMFPEHTCYASVFAGALWDLFKKLPSKCEVVNDINGNLMNFWSVIKEKPREFLEAMKWELSSRENFNRYKTRLENPEGLSDVERAKLFYYVLKTSYGGKCETYGISRVKEPCLNLKTIDDVIMSIHERLKRVNIENLDWRYFIPRYDSKDTLFYLDPPYRCKTSKRVYEQWFTDSDYRELSAVLRGVKGKFILSINDDDFIRETFRGFKVKEVETVYCMGITKAGSRKRVKELLISNFS